MLVIGDEASHTRYFSGREAYKFIKEQQHKGYKVYYIVPGTTRLRPVKWLSLKGNRLFHSNHGSLLNMEGFNLVAKNSEGEIVKEWYWSSTLLSEHSFSPEFLIQKLNWIRERLGKGKLYCYPQSSVKPFFITNLWGDAGGFFSLSEDKTLKVYLKRYRIYHVSSKGILSDHR